MAASSGGTGGQAPLGWKVDTFSFSAFFPSGTTQTLSSTPFDADAVVVFYDKTPRYPTQDFTISGTTITLLFEDDPTEDGLETTTKLVCIYPYLV